MPRVRGSSTAQYDQIIEHLFKSLYKPKATALDFTKDDLVAAMQALGITVRNVPDIKYTYDSREEFPSGISKTGHWAIIGRGKSKYSFVKISRPNLIHLPNDLPGTPPSVTLNDKTPTLVKQVLGNDEQATMTRLHYNDVIQHFAKLKVAFKVQGHERTTVSAGQIEIDEVYIGTDAAGVNYVFPISAKGGDDQLSFTQALSLNLYAAEKTRYSGFTRRPLGISKDPSGLIYIVEFSPSTTVQNLQIVNSAIYRIV